ncbi:MAG TPA: hypothetical protein VF234_00050 [Limnochordia bacterium]
MPPGRSAPGGTERCGDPQEPGEGGLVVTLLTVIGFVVVVIWLVNELPHILQ